MVSSITYVELGVSGGELSGVGLLEILQLNNEPITKFDEIVAILGMFIIFFVPSLFVKLANDHLFDGDDRGTDRSALKKVVYRFAPSAVF